MKSLLLAIFASVVLPASGNCAGAEQLNNLSSSAGTSGQSMPDHLGATEPLTLEGDIASNLVAGVDRFLLRELEGSEGKRERYWHRDYSSPEAYTASVATNRTWLAHILGVR